jgi:zinc transporter ZupT
MVITNQKAKAAVRTVAFVAVIVGVSIILQLVLANLTRQEILTVFMAFLGGAALYTVYSLFLAQIEYEDKIKEIAKK